MITSLLILNLWMSILAEAADQGPRGMTAVACVVRNRLEKGMGTGLVAANRKDLKAFCKNQGPSNIAMAKKIVQDVFSGKQKDITNGAIFFESTDYPIPAWAKGKKVVFKYKKHIFYR